MKIFTWNNIQEYLNTGISDSYFDDGTGISVGSFDGLHLGHRLLLNTLVDNCRSKKIKAGVITFLRPLPSIKHSADYQGDISTLDQRIELFELLGIDFVIVVDFCEEFASMLGTDFFNILVNACNLQLIAEGIDFRCGYKGATDAQAIKYFGQNNNVQTVFVDPIYYKEGTAEEERISSSFIRGMLINSYFSTVEELLVRPYELDLRKFDNQKNIKRKDILQVIPKEGIYHCKDENSNDVRLEITAEEFKLSTICKTLRF